jgi:hypothetical protein
VRLFEAPECVSEVFGAEITPFPTVAGGAALVPAAQQKGVMVVQVVGLEPDTAYCVQTVTTSLFSQEQARAPDPLLVVRTEKATTRARAAAPPDPSLVAFGNDLAKLAVTRSSPGAPTAGALVLVKVRGASSPLGAFVGDGIDDDDDPATPTTLALVNLNNLYDATSHESLDLGGDGSEDISARVLGSPEGFVTVHARIVPPDRGRSEVVTPLACRDASRTACDGRLGDSNGDRGVAASDADVVARLVVGLTPVLPCMVCADATWDMALDMTDALAIAQAVAGLRGLPW